MTQEELAAAIADGIVQAVFTILYWGLLGVAFLAACFVLMAVLCEAWGWVESKINPPRKRTTEEALKELDAGDPVDASAIPDRKP